MQNKSADMLAAASRNVPENTATCSGDGSGAWKMAHVPAHGRNVPAPKAVR